MGHIHFGHFQHVSSHPLDFSSVTDKIFLVSCTLSPLDTMLRGRTVELEETMLPLTRKHTIMGQMLIGLTEVALGMRSD
jgi:hypothetical protein